MGPIYVLMLTALGFLHSTGDWCDQGSGAVVVLMIWRAFQTLRRATGGDGLKVRNGATERGLILDDTYRMRLGLFDLSALSEVSSMHLQE
ncbi:hypothetical protein IEO21_08106 [Rhodonia placenta]|uniref:Uncharacterized protein n=1 Tax=Rhodonia placenta TaxID=104341 RepID=A0A8H7NXA8_9APHY|nr:hypothetical protein IEO21_08106 [Postia placenta]